MITIPLLSMIVVAAAYLLMNGRALKPGLLVALATEHYAISFGRDKA